MRIRIDRSLTVLLWVVLLVGCGSGSAHVPVADAGRDAGIQADARAVDASPPMDAALAVDAEVDASVPECTHFDRHNFTFQSTASELARGVPLTLEHDVPYRRLEIEFEMSVSTFHGECWSANLTRLMPRFNIFLDLRRGNNLCRGGSFFRAVLRGPGGPGNEWRGNDFRAYQNYKDQVYPTCGAVQSVDSEPIPSEKHSLATGVFFPVRIVYDFENHTLEFRIDGQVFLGSTYVGEELIARDGGEILLFFGRDVLIDCHDPPPNVTPESECCWGAPEGWSYRNLHYWTCP